MITAKLKINESRLKAKLRAVAINAFVDTVKELDQPLTEAFEAIIYDWDGITYRRSGEVVGSPRNIVDTGKLRDSQGLIFTSATDATYFWETEYALHVHEGYYLRNGGSVPARPWTQEALNTFDFRQNYLNNLRKYL